MPQVALPALAVSVRFVSGADNTGFALGTARLGTATLGDADDDSVWESVESDTRSVWLSSGKSRDLDVYRSSTASIVLDNRARAYDPLNLAGPHVSGGVTQIKPGRRIRIRATDPTTSTVHDMYKGTIREWGLGYTTPSDATATISASDQLTDLNNTDVTVLTTLALSGVVAVQVLDAAGIPADVQAGASTLQATQFTVENALTAMQGVVTAEQGALYATPDGVLQFDGRNALLTETRSNTSQATFGSGNLTIDQIFVEYASDLIKNAISVTRTGGTAQDATDATSVNDYGKRSHTITGAMNSEDTETLNMARHILASFKEPEVRVRSISIAPQAHGDLMTQALTRQLRDRITVYYVPPGGGTAISVDAFIAGINHQIIAGQMATMFTLESTTGRSSGWLLGTSDLGTGTILTF
ncbi:MAG: hypothetical protein O3A25_19585 [Acidobacteria bacterium]|nr:hypothetical protein [Acidobacteriota bacterium]